ncbi:MAG: hypothetical protein JXA11_02350 [Phycisphaerae bacterium]|nr:hypothetical protein [Phycisphaerae bacterium]
MAVTVEYKYKGIHVVANQSIDIEYIIRGTDDYDTALSALEAAAPEILDNMIRQPIELDEEHGDTVHPATGIWTATVHYVSPSSQQSEPPATGDSSFSFDTGGGTQHITQSLATIANYAASGTAPNHRGAIGVTKDSVEGVDITVPVYTWAETHYLADAIVTLGYRGSLFALTGRTNSASFKGMAAGECLFLGASGTKRGSGEDWEINFRFAGSPNRTGITVGSITGIAKKGWEYLWVEYESETDSSAKRIVKRPVAAHVEKVYEEGDFSILEIGT